MTRDRSTTPKKRLFLAVLHLSIPFVTHLFLRLNACPAPNATTNPSMLELMVAPFFGGTPYVCVRYHGSPPAGGTVNHAQGIIVMEAGGSNSRTSFRSPGAEF